MPARFHRWRYLLPRNPLFAGSYIAVALMAGYVGYSMMHTSSAAPLNSGQVQLLLGQYRYQVGETPRFTIINNTSQTISVTNNCPNEPLRVERQTAQGWVAVHDTFAHSEKCVNEPRSYRIVPKAQVSASYAYWPKIFANPGHYRITVPIEGAGDGPAAELDVVAGTTP